MSRTELERLLSKAPSLRLAVLGDFCLDAYWDLDATRSERSVETGLPTNAVRHQRYALGGAGNVVMNLRTLGVGHVSAGGVIGPDPFGTQMQSLLRATEIDTAGLLCQPADWSTHVYLKPLHDQSEGSRFDCGNFNVLAAATADALIAWLARELAHVHAVILNEQVLHGLHACTRLQAGLATLIARHPATPFLLDSRHLSDCYDGTIRKINGHEALRLCGVERPAGELVLLGEARQAATTLQARWRQPVFVTRGARGLLLCDATGIQEVPGLQIVGRVDPVGAGDSLLAGLAVGLAAGGDRLQAATLGNFVAGVTVQKLFQTGTASPDEVLAIGRDPDYVYRPELAEDPRQARFAEDSDIEVVSDWPAARRLTHAIFDHDGTISTLRQGWEQVMEPVMVHAMLGPRYADADESLYHRTVARVREFIDKTTGLQTLTQMEGLVAMVQAGGCVPAEEICDAAGYKAIYLQALMTRVRQRLAKLARGELATDDFTVKGAVPFLHRLHAAGVRLCLASGTDQADVRAEAAALGYAHLFEDRIHGAEAGVRTEAKKRVLERILASIGPAAGGQVVAFGDGPVEIRETHKVGGLAVGVASDEVRRFGLDASRRARLIRAGADLIVPDFSQGQRLWTLLAGGGAKSAAGARRLCSPDAPAGIRSH